MIKDTICQSLYFGVLVSLGAYLFGIWLREKTGFAVFNPLLVAIVAVIAILSFFHIDYDDYNVGGKMCIRDRVCGAFSMLYFLFFKTR